MRVLLDTHAFLWFVTDDPKLGAVGRATIADPDHEILFSPASYWEIAIKVSLGKYPLSVPFETFITQGIESNDLTILPIEPKHAAALSALSFHHRDPFDRLLVAQALSESIPILSADLAFDAYPITRLW